MNREIKFRIWDGEEFIYTEKYKELICGEPDFCICGDFSAFSFDNGRDWSNGVFQQYTGLKDKNGREIYEGDIVNTNDKNYQIVWCGAGFYCVGSDYPLDSCWFVGGSPKIIGNIFENSNLLK